MAATRIATRPVPTGGLAAEAARGVVAQVGVKVLDGKRFSQSPPGREEAVMVWRDNLEDEIDRMRDVAEDFSHVAMDTQFPGIVARPAGPFADYAAYNYQTLKFNVELTRVIQISMSFSDEKGNRPKGLGCWRFNFDFDHRRDLFSQQDSFSARGLDLERHRREGIEPHTFAELLMSSGLVLNEDIRWITSCGTNALSERPPEDGGRPREPPWVTFSGMYDFAHMLQLLTSQSLPNEVRGFEERLDLFFPSRCDVLKLSRLGQVPANGDARDARSWLLFRNAQHLLDTFFRMPDSIRRTAFERGEETVDEHPRRDRRRRDGAQDGKANA